MLLATTLQAQKSQQYILRKTKIGYKKDYFLESISK